MAVAYVALPKGDVRLFDTATQERVEVPKRLTGKVVHVKLARGHAQNDQREVRYLLEAQREEEYATGMIMIWELDEDGKRVSPHGQEVRLLPRGIRQLRESYNQF